MDISGMTCSGCESSVSRLLTAEGVQKKAVNYREKKATVTYDEDVLSTAELAELVDRSGHYHRNGRLQSWRHNRSRENHAARQ